MKREPWSILANYESSELVRKQFKHRHGRSLNDGKAKEICAAIVQARNYMSSANAADRNVRPLLVYYGVLSLSRALTLFLSPTLREAGLAQAHGLSVSGWGEELSKDTGDVATLEIKINANGTFRQLIEATEHKSFLRNNSSRPNMTATYRMPLPDTDVPFGELLARMPEVRDAFLRWKDLRRIVGIWPQGETAAGVHEIRVEGPFDERDVEAVLGTALTLKSKNGGVLIYEAAADTTTPSLSDMTGMWDVGTLVAVSRLPDDTELSKLAQAFIASYALGMLVRYYPSHWIGMLQNRRYDDALPTMLATLAHIEDAFPRMVLEFLEPERSGAESAGQ